MIGFKMLNKMEIKNRISTLRDYISQIDATILDKAGKEDVLGILNFVVQTPDSSVLMQWYWYVHSVLGFYVSGLDTQISRVEYVIDRETAKVRRRLSNESVSRVTENHVHAEASLEPAVQDQKRILHDLQRCLSFLSYVKVGLDADLIQSLGHNERLERKQDMEHY